MTVVEEYTYERSVYVCVLVYPFPFFNLGFEFDVFCTVVEEYMKGVSVSVCICFFLSNL